MISTSFIPSSCCICAAYYNILLYMCQQTTVCCYICVRIPLYPGICVSDYYCMQLQLCPHTTAYSIYICVRILLHSEPLNSTPRKGRVRAKRATFANCILNLAHLQDSSIPHLANEGSDRKEHFLPAERKEHFSQGSPGGGGAEQVWVRRLINGAVTAAAY